MKYVIGVDLGTSAVKLLLVNQAGEVVKEVSKEYPLFHEKSGYSEQNPEDWVEQTISGLKDIVGGLEDKEAVEGISFSGQMHGLVLLDEQKNVLRPSILWNDTRTTAECQEIVRTLGEKQLLEITKNPALEGFTLPKLLWVKTHEPEVFSKAAYFMLPKDYVRYRLTGHIHTEYSDAAGTLLLDVARKQWSSVMCETFGIPESICPPLVESHANTGTITAEIATKTRLSNQVKVFAGGADNACGAIGAGILEDGKTLCSIGTSGVVLSYETKSDKDFSGKVHYFNHGEENSFYTMGVTLAAGHSLTWFRNVFAENQSFDELLAGIEEIPAGANGLLFTPFLSGERTPYADSSIRGSFIGMDASHTKKDFTKAVLEGITFSLNESIDIFRKNGEAIDTVISIGGGAKNKHWLQLQADIFNVQIVKLTSEQGPGMGAAMLAAYGCGWFTSLKECADQFIDIAETYQPIDENVTKYKQLFTVYQQIYHATKKLNEDLMAFRE